MKIRQLLWSVFLPVLGAFLAVCSVVRGEEGVVKVENETGIFYTVEGSSGCILVRRPDGFYPSDFQGALAGSVSFGADQDKEFSTRMEELARRVTQAVEGYEGNWSIYIKDLSTQKTLMMHSSRMHPASMIKLFVMEMVFSRLDLVRENLALSAGENVPVSPSADQVDTLLENMIVYSDNESFNELVRGIDPGHGFQEGCRQINQYLALNQYTDTLIQHTLFPSLSVQEGIGETNYSSAKDCGILLEKIFRGKCVSEEASARMLSFLLAQDNTTKIRTGIPEGIPCANKTGETASSQHDAGIIYGTGTTYILSVFSEECPEAEAVEHIRELASISYSCLNDR